jgi:hypothetical protein
VNVAAPSIDALNDTIAVMEQLEIPTAGNVLANNGNGTDTLNGIRFTMNSINHHYTSNGYQWWEMCQLSIQLQEL